MIRNTRKQEKGILNFPGFFVRGLRRQGKEFLFFNSPEFLVSLLEIQEAFREGRI